MSVVFLGVGKSVIEASRLGSGFIPFPEISYATKLILGPMSNFFFEIVIPISRHLSKMRRADSTVSARDGPCVIDVIDHFYRLGFMKCYWV